MYYLQIYYLRFIYGLKIVQFHLRGLQNRQIVNQKNK